MARVRASSDGGASGKVREECDRWKVEKDRGMMGGR